MIKPGFKVHGECAVGDETVQFESVVYDIQDNKLWILYPNVSGLKNRTEIRLRVFPRKGDCYVANTRVLGRVHGQAELLELEMPERWDRERRRKYFRVPVDLVVRWDEHKGRCVNLSGNGCLFIAPAPLNVGQELEMTVELPTLAIPVSARVVRVEPLLDSRHRIAVTFLDMDDRHLDVLLKYLLDRQRRLIRDGKLP
ncbi:MAG: flagellar brake protein [Kyrpidia sp.]|nr:flagellar brake protein [Kyrpidia sp.]